MATPMFAPDGSVRMVPDEQWQQGLKNGGKKAVQMRDPNGILRYVPEDMVETAKQHGGSIVPTTTAEAAAQIAANPPSVPNAAQQIAANMHGEKFNPAEAIAYAVSNPKRGLEALGKGMEQTSNELDDTSNNGMVGAGMKHAASVSVGAIKSVPKGLIDADNLVRKGLNKVGGDYEMIETPKVLENKNSYETAGQVLENIAEFMWGEGELKALTHADKLAKLSKVAKIIEDVPALGRIMELGMKAAKGVHGNGIIGSAARQGIVGAGQEFVHSQGDAGDAATTGLVTAGTSAALGGVGKLGSKMFKAATEGTIEKGASLADDLAGKGAGEQYAGIANSLERGATSAEQAGRDALSTGNREAAENFATKAVTAPAEAVEASKSATSLLDHVKKSIADKEVQMHEAYDKGMKVVAEKAKDITVNISDSPLQKTAASLLENKAMPAELKAVMKNVVPDSERITPMLEELATSNKTYSWAEMDALRQQVGKQIRKLPFDSPIKSDLIKLRGAIDQTMENAAKGAKNGDVVDLIRGYRNFYANENKLFETNVIKQLSDKSPDSVAKILLNSESKFNVETLRKTIGYENMKAVEGGVFRNLLESSLGADGQFSGTALRTKFNRISPETKAALWGNRAADVEKFVDAASHARLRTAQQALRGASLAYGAYELFSDDNPSSKLLHIGVAVGLGHGVVRIPPEALANPTVLKTLGTLMKGGEGIKTRKTMSALMAALMNAAQN